MARTLQLFLAATTYALRHAPVARQPLARRLALAGADAFAALAEQHARGEWFAERVAYDADGALADDGATAIVRLRRDGDAVEHVLKVPATAVESSGCDRCASTIEWRELPLGSSARPRGS